LIPENIRGTYAALGTEVAISYFKQIGVTAIELLPVHHFVNDQFLEERKLTTTGGTIPSGILRLTPATPPMCLAPR
jgi:glycogen operon protein